MDFTLKRTPTWLPSGGFLLLMVGWTCGCHQDVRPQGGAAVGPDLLDLSVSASGSWGHYCAFPPFLSSTIYGKGTYRDTCSLLTAAAVCDTLMLFYLCSIPLLYFLIFFTPFILFFLPPACQLRHGHTTYIM